MTWMDRLQGYATLTSPEGTEFTALWRRNSRKSEKSLGVFKYPGYPGAQVQDLRVGATRIPMSIFFDGADNDLVAARFFTARREIGTWAIQHPVYGSVNWYMVSVEEVTDPTDSGNVTEIKTIWLDADVQDVPQSSAETAYLTSEQAGTLRSQTSIQMEAAVQAETVGALGDYLYGNQAAAVTSVSAVSSITSSDATTNAYVTSVYTSIQQTELSLDLDVSVTASQMQAVFAASASLSVGTSTGMGAIVTAIEAVIILSTADRAAVTVNTACVHETVAMAGLAALAEVIVNNEQTNRGEALYALELLGDTWDTIVTNLDANQTALSGSGFVSLSGTYTDAVKLVAMAQAVLLSRAFDLSASKTITLKTYRAPVEIALTEEVDLDDLIDTNGLKGQDILLLSPGTEITIYG